MALHHSKDINTAIIQLATIVAGMIGYVEEQIVGVTEGLMTQNPQRIQSVIDYTKNIRKLTHETTQKTIELFVNFKPKGDNAKLALISWRIAISLERISSLLYDIGAASKDIQLNDDISGVKSALENIKESLLNQTYNLVIAYTSDKPDLIKQIVAKQKHISDVYKSLFKEMIIFLIEQPNLTTKVEKCLDVAKSFEMVSIYMQEISHQLMIKFAKDKP